MIRIDWRCLRAGTSFPSHCQPSKGKHATVPQSSQLALNQMSRCSLRLSARDKFAPCARGARSACGESPQGSMPKRAVRTATRQGLWRLCANSRQHLGWFWTRNEVANLSRELSYNCRGVMVRPKTHSRLALSGQAPSFQLVEQPIQWAFCSERHTWQYTATAKHHFFRTQQRTVALPITFLKHGKMRCGGT